MKINKRDVAVLQAVLLLPSVLFMLALATRYLQLPQYHLADTARQIVMWYASRMWTLWLFLLALPFGALTIGGLTLLAAPRRLSLGIATTTLMSGGILAIVVLHMLAN